jgi:hypothetical protein
MASWPAVLSVVYHKSTATLETALQPPHLPLITFVVVSQQMQQPMQC